MKKMLNLVLAIVGLVVLIAGNSFAGNVSGNNGSSAFGWYSLNASGMPTLSTNGAISRLSASVEDSVGFGQWKVTVKDANGVTGNFWYSVQDGTSSDGTHVKQETFVRADNNTNTGAQGVAFTQKVAWNSNGSDTTAYACGYSTILTTGCFKETMDYKGMGGGNRTMNIYMVATENSTTGDQKAYDFRTEFNFDQIKDPSTGNIQNNFYINSGIADSTTTSTDYTQEFRFEQKQASVGVANQNLTFACQFAACVGGTLNDTTTANGLRIVAGNASATISSGTDPADNRLVQVYFDDVLKMSSNASTSFSFESINHDPDPGSTANDYKYQLF